MPRSHFLRPTTPPTQASLRGGEVGAASISAAALFTETIAPTLGTMFSNGMYLSGLPAILEAREKGRLGSLNPIPFAMSLANCKF